MIYSLAAEKYWVQKHKYHDAEKKYYEQDSKNFNTFSLVSEIVKAREHIRNSLEKIDGIPSLASSGPMDFLDRLNALEKEQAALRKMMLYLEQICSESTERISILEAHIGL
ncbi:probable elongation factor 1-delta [Condylostylus longicornis]|uniref:probable elongation factor 1-delta n=1 Tax=Condylostylus longicornis TaxID=2530218 RepID=UPI00244DB744|nr:probable elongation factor 1-delta [Condylostylus longicornis]